MKKLAIASLLCLGISGFTSCDKVKDLTNVNINLDNADGILTLPVIPVAGTASLGAAEVSVNLDSMIKAQNSQVSADNIKEVHIKSCELVMLDGNSSNNFSALQSCSLKISSDQNATPQVIAEVTDNPDTEAYSLNLPVNTGLELKGYFLNAKKFTYSVAGTARKATTKEIKCQVKIKYNLVIGL